MFLLAKIRRSRIKEGDRLSIRLKQAKLECTENEDLKTKLLIEPTVHKVKSLNSRFQNNKRPRGRPKKSSDNQDRIPLKFPDDNNNTNLAVISPNVVEEKVKPESLHLKVLLFLLLWGRLNVNRNSILDRVHFQLIDR